MKGYKRNYLQESLQSGEFRFARLDLPDIDNQPVIDANTPEFAEQELCLFHRSIQNPIQYINMLDDYIRTGIVEKKPSPVVRFADGEYAFYNLSLACNGLYKQAESVPAIRRALPMHLDALRRLAENGKIAPVVFPGNIRRNNKTDLFSFFSSLNSPPSPFSFWNFLGNNGIKINGTNYMPFFIVYAYLTSEEFARLLDRRKLCILNSEYNRDSCRRWFSPFGSCPEIVFVEIPAEYVATRWEAVKEYIFQKIPADVDLCLAGAGVGALMVCVDVSERYSVPVIDAGHVLNMMNGREDKSNGARMYTIRKSRQISLRGTI